MTDRVLAALVRLVGANAHAAVELVSDETGLIGSEPKAIAKAVPKRQNEFAAGRRAARAALRKLGHTDVPIPAGEDRAPLWPKGVFGAITHDDGLAAALVAKAEDCDGVGIDIAEAAPFPRHLRERILISEAERALNDLDARAVFSAKEALFKALYPAAQTFFGFEAAEVIPDFAGETFSARLTQAVGTHAVGSRFNGGLTIADNRLLATLIVSR